MSSSPIQSPSHNQQRIRLLLIEDHAGVAELTAEFLRDTGLEVRIARSGREGMDAAEAFRPEIVLCDMSLPDMSGLDVVRALRVRPDTKDALLAIHTAMSDADTQSLESHLDADDINLYLSKPITQKKLDRLLAALAALRQPSR
jgi:CheY-like chemotaxis protein